MAERAIDPVARQAQLRRLLRRQARAPQGPWLHAEVARRMAERLALVRLQPRHVLEWWGGLGASDAVLQQALPQAQRLVVEPDTAWAEYSRRQREPAWWSARRWTGAQVQVQTESDALPRASQQLVWANMVLHAVSDPPSLFVRWQQALAVDGFVMFSCLGPDTLKELRSLYARLGWAPPGIDFVDMHDLGDMLVHAGLADPVMDQETLHLSWTGPEALLDELRSLGGNAYPGRMPGLRGRGWHRRLLRELEALRNPEGRLELSVEIVYGHAFKAPVRLPVAASSSLSLEDMRDMLRGPSRDQGGPGLR
jgi:malonyl-CoA O-methyltransferase